MVSTHVDELKLMTNDNYLAGSPYRVTDVVWTTLSQRFRDRINKHGVDDIWQFNTNFAMWPPGDRHYQSFAEYMKSPPAINHDWYAASCETFMSHLQARDTHGVIKRSTFELDWDVLLSLEEVISLVNVDQSLLNDHKVVVDLGSGWGRIGYVLMKVNPKLTYVACDIPESLIVAQVHLPRKLPSTPVRLYSENRTLERFMKADMLSRPGLWFCGAQDLDKFDDASVDLFINVFSFQEMTMQQVTEYFNVVDRVAKGGIFYNQQRCGKMAECVRETYPYLPTWNKLFDRTVTFSDYHFEAAFKL